MITIVKNKLDVLIKSKTAINGVWLYILQIFNTVIPLVTLPYITRILGPSQYGVFSSALNLVGYFQVIVEYGFNLTGTRKIALAKDKNDVSEIYSRITLARLFLCAVTFFVMIGIGLLINITKIQFLSMIILYSMVLGIAIQQTWLFQGMQVMKYITIVSVVSRMISVIMIFVLVNNTKQVYLYCNLYALTFLLMGVISAIIIRFKYNIRLKKVRISELIYELKDGWYLFTTSAMTRIFSGIGITVLTFTSTDRIVGIYSAIQKIPLMITMIYAPIGQVIYPYVSKYYASSYNSGIKIVKIVSKYVITIFSVISMIIIINSKFIINILYGSDYSMHSLALLPLILWMMLSIFNNLLGIQVLVASGHTKEYSISFRIGVMAIIIFNIILGKSGGMFGIAIAAMLAECTLTIAIIFQIGKISSKFGNKAPSLGYQVPPEK